MVSMKKFDVIKRGNDQILVISGASGVGKTTFSLQLAANMALKGHKIFYGSAEMTRNQVFNRIVASGLSLSAKAIDEDTILKEDKESIAKFMTKVINNKFYVNGEFNSETNRKIQYYQ